MKISSRIRGQLTLFLAISLGAHALAFSLFRDPGEFIRIPPHGPGKVTLLGGEGAEAGLASIYDPSAIVLPRPRPGLLAGKVTLPWSETGWAVQETVSMPEYHPNGLGADAPLPVRAANSIASYRSKPLAGRPREGGRATAKTWFDLEGGLKDRLGAKTLSLPALQSSHALEPTSARLGVDEDGAVRFVFLEGTTGDPGADREASNLLRGWRFEPEPGRWVEWGRVKILWAVEPVPGERQP
ncbi:MAG: hypothetical protein EB090_03595 [Verrucomicrobia bacterium]|nr:hypothetical protein [Verrucomicrobiota bacterium]